MNRLCTGIILAGGKSRRFGRDKAAAMLDGKSFMKRQTELLAPIVDEIIIVSNDRNKFDLPNTLEISDTYRNIGPMGGIQAGLRQAFYETCIILACDMPLMKREFVKNLLEVSNREVSDNLIIPVHKKGIEPLCGIYKKSCLGQLEQSIKSGERKLTDWIEKRKKEGKVTYISVKAEEENYFYNVNTEQDYRKIIMIRKNMDKKLLNI